MSHSVPENFNLTEDSEPSYIEKVFNKLWMQYRNKIDRYIIFKTERWIFTALLSVLYLLRVLISGGFYVISYVLGLYILHAFVRFVTPLGLPDIEEDEEEKMGEELPIFGQTPGDSKPLIRSVSEFKFWQGITIALLLSNVLISSEAFDLPVYWPFLLGYFVFLVGMTARKHMRHMEKYGYSITDFGRKANTK